MGSLLAALTAIVVTVLAALLAVPHFLDWNAYKPEIERQIAALVGRDVRILGDLDLRILPAPTFDVRGLRIADEFGKFEQPFAEVEHVTALLGLPSLLTGTLEARSATLDQPIIRLKIDEFNEGTWLSVGPYGFEFPLPVSDIVLENVQITDGAIELRRAHQSAAARFDRIEGTVSSAGIAGPFRFEGTGHIAGGPKTIQLSAVKIPDEPRLKLKASLRSTDGISLYQLDGAVEGLDGPLHYTGPLVARLALDTEAKEAEETQIAEPMAGKAIELRSEAKISLEEASLENINVTVTENDRPQTLTGSALASWSDTPRLDLTVESSWLDFDQLMRGTADGPATILPSDVIASLPLIFEGWEFRPRQGRIAAKIQQAGIGGDIVEDLNFTASHNREGWQIDTLTARLPGETTAEGRGALPAGENLNFAGTVKLSGENLPRLLRWAAPSLGVVNTGNSQIFSLSSDVTLSANHLAFRQAQGSLGESSFKGDLVHEFGDRSSLLVAIESQLLDLRDLYDLDGTDSNAGLEAETLAGAPDGSWSAQVVPAERTTLPDVLTSVFAADQSNVSLSIATLRLPGFQARDLRTAFLYDNGTFDIRELNVATTDGLKIDASGRMTGFDSTPEGALTLVIDAPSAQSVTNLARFAGFDIVSSGAKQRIEALSPFNLRGSLNATAAENRVRLSVAGSAGGSELTFNGSMRGNFDQLEDAQIDFEGGMGNSDSNRLIKQLAPEVPYAPSDAQAGAGFLEVSAKGVVKTGLTSLIQLRTPQATGKFDGQISLMSEPSWSFDGLLDMRAIKAETALSMLRVSPGGAPVTGPIDLRAVIKKNASQFQIFNLALQIGGENITGSIDADLSGERPTGDVNIEAASVSLPKIAAYLVDWDRDDISSQVSTVAAGDQAVWPNKAFNLNALTGLDGSLNISAPDIEITDKIRLKDGTLKASLNAGSLTVSELKGGVFGGSLDASGSLTRLDGRLGADINLDLRGIDAAAFSAAHGGREVVRGSEADLSISASGEGLSPSGLVSIMNGNGNLSLSSGQLQGVSHSALKTAAETYLTQEIPSKDDLISKLENDLFEGSFAFEPVEAPLVIKDGILRIAEATFADSAARLDANLVVDLNSLRFDSVWAIASPEKIEGDVALPPVSVAFAGPVSQFSSATADMNAAGFERFLTIRRMDQDMERLERLQRDRGLRERQGPSGQRLAPPQRAGPGPGADPGLSARTGAQPPLPQALEDGSVPNQSLLRAPSADPPPAISAEPPILAPNENAVSGWSTDVEATPEPDGADIPDTSAGSSSQPPQAQNRFEDEIRRVLRAQQENALPPVQ